ncbi:hypothetical protein EXIGLDRAFT_694805 [Exidia glandulosa HHB12029]|uniref:Transmembrane protein n=1 Tax=Exidia glandulosa HHB12029 TaxID=1314781 RepID=A0A165NJS7_EXIGL|nr:hypothetical protein EXIGLDRAFT_694805 [Exidia glandulosa HHB12029]
MSTRTSWASLPSPASRDFYYKLPPIAAAIMPATPPPVAQSAQAFIPQPTAMPVHPPVKISMPFVQVPFDRYVATFARAWQLLLTTVSQFVLGHQMHLLIATLYVALMVLVQPRSELFRTVQYTALTFIAIVATGVNDCILVPNGDVLFDITLPNVTYLVLGCALASANFLLADAWYLARPARPPPTPTAFVDPLAEHRIVPLDESNLRSWVDFFNGKRCTLSLLKKALAIAAVPAPEWSPRTEYIRPAEVIAGVRYGSTHRPRRRSFPSPFAANQETRQIGLDVPPLSNQATIVKDPARRPRSSSAPPKTRPVVFNTTPSSLSSSITITPATFLADAAVPAPADRACVTTYLEDRASAGLEHDPIIAVIDYKEVKANTNDTDAAPSLDIARPSDVGVHSLADDKVHGDEHEPMDEEAPFVSATGTPDTPASGHRAGDVVDPPPSVVEAPASALIEDLTSTDLPPPPPPPATTQDTTYLQIADCPVRAKAPDPTWFPACARRPSTSPRLAGGMCVTLYHEDRAPAGLETHSTLVAAVDDNDDHSTSAAKDDVAAALNVTASSVPTPGSGGDDVEHSASDSALSSSKDDLLAILPADTSATLSTASSVPVIASTVNDLADDPTPDPEDCECVTTALEDLASSGPQTDSTPVVADDDKPDCTAPDPASLVDVPDEGAASSSVKCDSSADIMQIMPTISSTHGNDILSVVVEVTDTPEPSPSAANDTLDSPATVAAPDFTDSGRVTDSTGSVDLAHSAEDDAAPQGEMDLRGTFPADHPAHDVDAILAQSADADGDASKPLDGQQLALRLDSTEPPTITAPLGNKDIAPSLPGATSDACAADVTAQDDSSAEDICTEAPQVTGDVSRLLDASQNTRASSPELGDEGLDASNSCPTQKDCNVLDLSSSMAVSEDCTLTVPAQDTLPADGVTVHEPAPSTIMVASRDLVDVPGGATESVTQEDPAVADDGTHPALTVQIEAIQPTGDNLACDDDDSDFDYLKMKASLEEEEFAFDATGPASDDAAPPEQLVQTPFRREGGEETHNIDGASSSSGPSDVLQPNDVPVSTPSPHRDQVEHSAGFTSSAALPSSTVSNASPPYTPPSSAESSLPSTPLDATRLRNPGAHDWEGEDGRYISRPPSPLPLTRVKLVETNEPSQYDKFTPYFVSAFGPRPEHIPEQVDARLLAITPEELQSACRVAQKEWMDKNARSCASRSVHATFYPRPWLRLFDGRVVMPNLTILEPDQHGVIQLLKHSIDFHNSKKKEPTSPLEWLCSSVPGRKLMGESKARSLQKRSSPRMPSSGPPHGSAPRRALPGSSNDAQDHAPTSPKSRKVGSKQVAQPAAAAATSSNKTRSTSGHSTPHHPSAPTSPARSSNGGQIGAPSRSREERTGRFANAPRLDDPSGSFDDNVTAAKAAGQRAKANVEAPAFGPTPSNEKKSPFGSFASARSVYLKTRDS